ncbi:MAG: cation diffusion facilitator family transporter [Bacteroidetes bacterium]|nr:cation diffusion facilitator family transporter [Bacteroidota bacterium]
MKNRMEIEKKRVAGVSVIAAFFLTGFKLVVGLLTGSLGLLSEALHSGLDLVAAIITYFSVRISDKPPDKNHHYGHGKIENFSALIETFLLLITCAWIIYEAVHRLVSGDTRIEVNMFSYFVVLTSIAIDIARSRALYRVARKYNSQALEADALHFSTDIWSSAVVLLGLIMAQFGWFFADSVSALAVAFIVLGVSWRLGKRAADVLLDRSPAPLVSQLELVLNQAQGILRYHDLKVRTSGAENFIEVTIHVQPGLALEQAHAISHLVEKQITHAIPRSFVHVHIEPDEHQPDLAETDPM